MVEIFEVPSPEHEMRQQRQGGQGAFLSPLKKGDQYEIVEAPAAWSPGERSDGSSGDGNQWGGGLTFKIQDDDDVPPPVQNLTVKQGLGAAMSSSSSGVAKRPASGVSSVAGTTRTREARQAQRM